MVLPGVVILASLQQCQHTRDGTQDKCMWVWFFDDKRQYNSNERTISQYAVSLR